MSEGPLVEVTTCQVCGSDRGSALFEEAPYSVRRCEQCGLVYVTPRLPQEVLHDHVYGEHYWKSDSPKTRGYSDYAADEELYLKTFRRRLALLPDHGRTPLRVLDVGCAAGFFLRVMKEHGHDVHGVEPSAAIAAHAQSAIGRDAVWVGTLDDLPADRPGFEQGTFDLVTMWDVVEHVVDPQSLLRQARELLKPGGMLLLETQNVDSAFASLLGRRWHHYKHQEHLYHFNRETVKQVLDQAGFDVVRNTASYGGKYVSLGFIAERAARLHKILSVVLSPLALLRNANVYVNLRDEMVVMARPRSDRAGAAAQGEREGAGIASDAGSATSAEAPARSEA